MAIPLVNHGTAAMIFASVAMALAVFVIRMVIDLLSIQLFKMIRINALCKKLGEVFNIRKRNTFEIVEPARVVGPVEETIDM